MASIALSVICTGDTEIENIKRMLKSAAAEVDRIYVTCNHKPYSKVKALEKKYSHLSVDFLPWNDDFTEQRNHNASLIQEDVYIWLDCDDELVAEKGLLKKLAEVVHTEKLAGFMVNYDYAKGLAGYSTSDHEKLRIVNNKLGLQWVKSLHENIDHQGYEAPVCRDFEVKHHLDEDSRLEKTERNYRILMKELAASKEGEEDPRTIGYVGRTALTYAILVQETNPQMAKKLLAQSISSFEVFKQRSGWNEEIYFCLMLLADAYHLVGNLEKEESSLLEAVKLFPGWCEAYCKLCIMENIRGNYVKSADWGKIALNSNPPTSVLGSNEELRVFLCPLSFVDSLIHLGRYDLAAQILVKMDKENPMVVHYAEIVKEMAEDVAYQNKTADFLLTLNKLHPDNAAKVVESLPGDVLQSKKVAGLARSLVKQIKHSDDSVVIFCGMGIGDDWADPSVITGIGGSEEAVIYLSRELTKLGKKVTVYNSCGEMAGEYNGVVYKPWSLFNPEDTFSTLIMWRNPQSASHSFNAKHVWIWLHDVTEDKDIPDTIADNVKFIFLSKYHRSLAPSVPEEKVIYSRNGLDLTAKDVERLFSKVERHGNRIVYASSYDRGLEHLLIYWPTILDACPGAELHIAYGWNTFDRIRKDKESLEWKAYMNQMMNQPGIVHHGKLGAKQLKELFASSNVWCYPCHFKEISCITAMRAQALGAYPVTTGYAALSETVVWGHKVRFPGSFEDELTFAPLFLHLATQLQSPITDDVRKEEALKAVENFSWEGVAKDWVSNMN